jgi:nucleotide-binding universal stress UspA family protein
MHVLVGFTGTEQSRLALENTLERAVTAGDTVTVGAFAGGGQTLDEVAQAAQSTLEKWDVETDLVRIDAEHPASRLVELAETGEYEQLVIGGGEESPMGKIELGTITEYVLLNAQVTVRLER